MISTHEKKRTAEVGVSWPVNYKQIEHGNSQTTLPERSRRWTNGWCDGSLVFDTDQSRTDLSASG